MIILKTNDERLRGLCNLWNAVRREDMGDEDVTLLNGEVISSIVVKIKVPILNLDNRSLHPQIYRDDRKTAVIIPFYFPRDFKSKYDMSMILDAMTWTITDTLSVYCAMDVVHRYWLEQNLHQRNEYFLKSVGTGLRLDQTLSNLHDQVLLNEMRMDDPLKSIPLSSIDELTTEEEVSHIAHKARLTTYLFIVPFETVLTSIEVLPFYFSKPPSGGGFSFTQLDAVRSIINKFPKGSKFFSFIKHVSSTAKNLPYFPRGHLKDLDAKQLNAIVQTTKIPRSFNKNKPIDTTFTQMIILNFYITMKECLSQPEFTKIIREEAVPLETQKKIFHSAAEILPYKVTQKLRETLQRYSNLKDFDLDEMLPRDVLLQDPDKVDMMNDSAKAALKQQFEKLSRFYGDDAAKNQSEMPSKKIQELTHIIEESRYLNTILSYYTHLQLLSTLQFVSKISEQLEEVQENESDTYEVLELLLMSISNHQECDSDYTQSHSLISNKTNQEKFDRISGRIPDFLDDFDEQLQSVWDIEDYLNFLEQLAIEDDYVETLRESITQMEMNGQYNEETDFQFIEVGIIHQTIYGLIGYYYNFHHTMEILQTVKNSTVPALGNINVPLKDSYSMTFNHTFNAFTPRSTEFTEDEYEQFCTIIKSLR